MKNKTYCCVHSYIAAMFPKYKLEKCNYEKPPHKSMDSICAKEIDSLLGNIQKNPQEETADA